MGRLEETRTSGYWIACLSLLLAMGGLAAGAWWWQVDASSRSETSDWEPYAMGEAIEPSSRDDRTPTTSEPSDRDDTSRVRTVSSETPSRQPGQQRRGDDSGARDLQPSLLRVVTNFEKADVTVNGMPYPEYVEEDEDQNGMVLPAGGPYTVRVNYNGKTKVYTITLRPYRTRILMVELSGFKGGSVSKTSGGSPSPSGSNESQQGQGRVTVYSKPKGSIIVDGEPRDQQTPGTVQVPAGRHDVQVRFEEGGTSESKTVRVRQGSRIKLFFRKD
jgi:hypothetical protein